MNEMMIITILKAVYNQSDVKRVLHDAVEKTDNKVDDTIVAILDMLLGS